MAKYDQPPNMSSRLTGNFEVTPDESEAEITARLERSRSYYPRYGQRRDVEDEHWMIQYESENGAEYISTLNDFFGYVQVNDERVGHFTVVASAPPKRRPRTIPR